jgi:CheY-like chemotaxis protein
MPGSQPLILIVDDEEHLAVLAAFFLRRAGYRTLKATSGHEALEMWNSDVDVLLTDCAMPDIFGDQLAIRLLERNPALKILFMSGNPAASLETSIPLEPSSNFILKPFRCEELIEFVRHALQPKDQFVK